MRYNAALPELLPTIETIMVFFLDRKHHAPASRFIRVSTSIDLLCQRLYYVVYKVACDQAQF